MSRIRIGGLIIAAAGLLLLFGLRAGHAGRASAFEEWCADDPVVSVQGKLMDIQVQMPVANLLTMRTTYLTVVIPNNVSGAVIVDDVSAFPMTTIISASGAAWSGSGSIPVTIVTNVQATGPYTTRTVATPASQASLTAYGVANTPFSLSLNLN